MSDTKFANVAGEARSTALGQRFVWDGLLLGRNQNTPTFWSGTGAPTTTTNPTAKSGDFYFRKDGGGAGATHIYFLNGATWIGIA